MSPVIFAFSLSYSSYSSSIIFQIQRIRHTTSTDFTDSRRHNRSLTEHTDITDIINQLPNTPGHRTSSASMYNNASSPHTVSLCQLTSISLCFRSSSVGLHNCLTIEFPFCFISCNHIPFCLISRNHIPFLSDFLQPYFLFVLLSLTFLFDHLPKIPTKPL